MCGWVDSSALIIHPAHLPRVPAGEMPIVSKMGVKGGNRYGWRLFKQDNNRFGFILGPRPGTGGVSGSPTAFASMTTATIGKWYHVAVVKGDAEIVLHVNGVREAGGPSPTVAADDSAPLAIGRDPVREGRFGSLDGLIDEVSLYNRALSHLEVESLYLDGLSTANGKTGAADFKGLATGAPGGSKPKPGTKDEAVGRSGQTFVHAAKEVVRDVAWGPDGSWILSGWNRIKRWDIKSGRELSVISHAVHDFTLSRDGRRVAGADTSRDLKIWDVETGELVVTCAGKRKAAFLDFSPDGGRLAAAGGVCVQIWDAVTGRELLELGGNEPSSDVPRGAWNCNGIKFSPDGRRIAANSGLTRIWSTVAPPKNPVRSRPVWRWSRLSLSRQESARSS